MKSFVKAGAIAVAGATALMGGAGAAAASDDGSGASAKGVAAHSPGVLSGNLIQVPVSVPINLCGNTVNIVALLNPTFGNACVNR
ncbi:chaplin [Streptomyces sp. NPDC020681]|uniref:chaplin n=1 Tax=Streptomyces sp. NPDC020681 TaxID=3365083 RepID=UPI0037A206D2